MKSFLLILTTVVAFSGCSDPDIKTMKLGVLEAQSEARQVDLYEQLTLQERTYMATGIDQAEQKGDSVVIREKTIEELIEFGKNSVPRFPGGPGF